MITVAGRIDTADAVERVLSGEKPQAAGPGERASANQRRQPDRGGSNRRGSSREAAGSRRGQLSSLKKYREDFFETSQDFVLQVAPAETPQPPPGARTRTRI